MFNLEIILLLQFARTVTVSKGPHWRNCFAPWIRKDSVGNHPVSLVADGGSIVQTATLSIHVPDNATSALHKKNR